MSDGRDPSQPARPTDDDQLDEPVPHLSQAPSQGLEEESTEVLLPTDGRLGPAFKIIGLAEQAIGTMFIAVILVLVLLQVAQRYLPSFGGWPWTGEIARLSLVWCTFILSGYLLGQGRHITIKVIDFVVTGRALELVKLFAHAVVTVTAIALAYTTYLLIVEDIGQRTPAAGIPLAWVYVLPMIGLTLTAIRGVLAVIMVDIPRVLRPTDGQA